MAAFDQLPRSVRDALNYSKHKWNTENVLRALERGRPVSDVFAALEKRDI